MVVVDRSSTRSVLRGVLLASTAVLVAARPYVFPSVNLDPSWGTGLLLGRVNDLKWGSELDFTYGPWGWLTVPIVIDRTLMVMSALFTIAASIFAVLVIWKLLRRSISEFASVVMLMFVVLPFLSQVSITEVFLVGIFGSFVLLFDRSVRGITESWPTVVAVALPVALAMQVKASIGIFAVVGYVVISGIWWRSPKRLALCFSSLTGWFLLLWVLSEGSFTGMGEWTRLSVSVVGGFASAMSMSLGQPMALLLFCVFCTGTVVLLIRMIRNEQWPLSHNLIASLLVVLTLYSALKIGYVREEQFRILDGYALCLPLWIWLLSPVKNRVRHLAFLALPVIVGLFILMGQRPAVRSVSGIYDWPARLGVWVDNSRLLASTTHFENGADQARQKAQAIYGLSDQMLANLRDASVQVDPFETTLVWAYGLRWAPVPIFQTYQAYTTQLDETNTEALARRSERDAVLIETNQVKNINDRLSLWTPPRYQLALTCSWKLRYSEGRWEQWTKTEDRCGDPEIISRSSVGAHQQIEIPQGAPNEIVVTKFERSSSWARAIERGFQFVYKPTDPFDVQLDGVVYQQPRSFDGSPLLVSCPPGSELTNRYAAVCPTPKTIAFSESGTVTFERRSISPT